MEQLRAAWAAERDESRGYGIAPRPWGGAPAPRLVLRFAFDADPAAPGQSRAAVAAALHASPNVDVITLMVSELVTNAVMHTGREAELRVLDLGGGDIRVEVEDLDGRLPTPTPAAGANGGFGLRIVGAHARAWGTSMRDHGKVVWFEIGAGSAPAGPE